MFPKLRSFAEAAELSRGPPGDGIEVERYDAVLALLSIGMIGILALAGFEPLASGARICPHGGRDRVVLLRRSVATCHEEQQAENRPS